LIPHLQFLPHKVVHPVYIHPMVYWSSYIYGIWYMVSQQQQRFFLWPTLSYVILKTDPLLCHLKDRHVFFHTSPYISHVNRFVYIFLCRFYFCKTYEVYSNNKKISL
jgi:hypothetical protein